ncbi:tRNA-dihydrouridine(20a/20b) synthase [NAD(P)+]-like protein [Thelohanellus kitauei]|uniref:tRNA-dihydrouridine synthase n=1 Tax=Thelohanellus kitauei TaxID=669202 RepID=A0A0C2ID36_THEKT|nr:tRNA-dihydrouridine(20a/20b) synthase [NAD(P)+]-like protein [Thelohanellus kitauei]
MLVRKYNVDVAFTPMIISNDFFRSEKARMAEFSTDTGDRPLIAQFAANDGPTLVKAVSHLHDLCDGVDINCGCPQKWLMDLEMGSSLLYNTETIYDLINHLERNFGNLCRSIKIRLHDDLRVTFELVKRAEMCGVHFITVHCRTRSKGAPINYEAFSLIKESIGIPAVINGDIFNRTTLKNIQDKMKPRGIMCARALLNNPSFFTESEKTSVECIKEYVELAHKYQTKVTIMKNMLIFMTRESMTKNERSKLALLKKDKDIVEFIATKFGIEIDDFHFTDHIDDKFDLDELFRKNFSI